MKNKTLKIIIIVLLVIALAAGAIYVYETKYKQNRKTDFDFEPVEESTAVEEDTSHGYSVSSSNDIVTEVGMSVLESGGNAVDAAIAMTYTLSVVEPYASGIGGSGGMLVYDSNTGECKFYDYRAAAGSSYGTGSIGIPGVVAGMDYVHNIYGSISMSDLIEPAIYYAENGFEIYQALYYRLGGMSAYFTDDGSTLQTGDTMYQHELAETLKVLQEKGKDAFYTGEIADKIVERTSLTKEDLSSYEVYEYDTKKRICMFRK